MAVAHLRDSLSQSQIPRDLIRIGECSRLLNVSCQSVRNWARDGEIECYLLRSGERRFSRASILAFANGTELERENVGRLCVTYCRTSTASQKESLLRQIERVKNFAAEQYSDYEQIHLSDNSSGANFNRRGLKALLQLILSGQLKNGVIVCEFRDRIGRMAISLLTEVCAIQQVQLVYVEEDQNKTDEELLLQDITSIMHLFNMKNYSKRGNRRQVKQLSDRALEVGKALYEKGATIKQIQDEFIVLGITNDDGSAVSLHSIRKYIQIQDTVTRLRTSDNSSAEIFARKHAEKVAPTHRVLIRDAYQTYLVWAKREKQPYCNKVMFTKAVRKFFPVANCYVDRKHVRAFAGMKLSGCGQRTVRERVTANQS